MKPRIGKVIRYTEEGAPRGWSGGDVAGEVVSLSSMSICNFRNKSGDIESFIYEFSDGYNTFFEWDGKQDV